MIHINFISSISDHCPIRLRALRYGYGLLNFGISTKSHCECDKDFFNCLKSVNSKLSNTIGHVYFNVLKLQCIEEGPACVEYEYVLSFKTNFVFFLILSILSILSISSISSILSISSISSISLND